MLFLMTQPALYKTFGNFACCLFEWIIYTLLKFDVFVTSLTLSYFYFKINIKLFTILNLIYCFLYCFGHDCSKFNKQFYFTLLPTPAPTKCSRNNNLNVPFFIFNQNWSSRAKVISINVMYLIFQVFMSVLCYKPLYEVRFIFKNTLEFIKNLNELFCIEYTVKVICKYMLRGVCLNTSLDYVDSIYKFRINL